MVLLSSFLSFVCLQITNGLPVNVEVSLKLNVKQQTKDPTICKTAICNETARKLLKYPNLEADPCLDFFQFACGNFLKNEIPIGQKQIGPNADTKIHLRQNLISILEDPVSENKFKFERQTKMAFQSCMNRTAIDKGGVQDLKKVLQTYGGWPLLEGDKWKEENSNLTMILTKMHLLNIAGFYGVIIINFRNQIIPVITREVLPLRLDSYKEKSSTVMQVYREYLINTSLNIGDINADDNFIKSVDDIVGFDRSLAECAFVQLSNTTGSGGIYALETFRDIFEKTFDMESVFKSLYKNGGVNLKPNESIITYDIVYLKCVSKLLENTPKRNVVNYLIWNVVMQSYAALPESLREFGIKFRKASGYYTDKAHWEFCIDIVDGYLPQSTGYLYVMRHFPRTTKNKLMHIFQQLKSVFKGIILNEKWITDRSRNISLLKLEQMRAYIGYPDIFDDPTILDAEFAEVDFSQSSFLEILNTMKMMRVNRQVRSLRDNSDEMLASILTDHAIYLDDTNKIEIPAGTLLLGFYEDSHPTYLKFGGIGAIMGHEMGHGLDSIDATLTDNDHIKEIFQEKDRENLQNKSECLLNQFKKAVPGNTYLSTEIIADNIGVRISYMAYKNWLKKHGAEEQLPGFPYTPIQMFFVAYARTFCNKVNETNIGKGTHPPDYLRINIAMKNMKAFSNAFKCKAGSEMNPSEKCRFW